MEKDLTDDEIEDIRAAWPEMLARGHGTDPETTEWYVNEFCGLDVTADQIRRARDQGKFD